MEQPSSGQAYTYGRLSRDSDGVAELTAQFNTEVDGVVGGSRVGTVGASTLDKVVLERGRITEAVVHVGKSAVQRRMLSDDIGEAVDLSVKVSVLPCIRERRPEGNVQHTWGSGQRPRQPW